jgi:hypothetical protein
LRPCLPGGGGNAGVSSHIEQASQAANDGNQGKRDDRDFVGISLLPLIVDPKKTISLVSMGADGNVASRGGVILENREPGRAVKAVEHGR